LRIPSKLDSNSTEQFHGKLDTDSTSNWTVGA